MILNKWFSLWSLNIFGVWIYRHVYKYIYIIYTLSFQAQLQVTTSQWKSPSGSAHEPRKARVEEIRHLSKLVLAGGVKKKKRIARVNRRKLWCIKHWFPLTRPLYNPYFWGGTLGGGRFSQHWKNDPWEKALGIPIIPLNCQTILPFTVYSFSGSVRFGYEDIKERKL